MATRSQKPACPAMGRATGGLPLAVSPVLSTASYSCPAPPAPGCMVVARPRGPAF